MARRKEKDRIKFSDPWVKNAPPGEHYDAGEANLGLRVSPRLKRVWFFRGKLADGRQVRRSLGTYPEMTLAQARKAAEDTRGQARRGELEEVKRDRPLTFGEAAEKALAVMALSTRERTIRERRRILTHDLLPAWKGRPVESITRSDVASLVERIAERGSPVMANRTLSLVRALYNALLDLELVEANPASRPKRFLRPEKPKERALSKAELKAVIRAVQKEGPVSRAFFGLALNTLQRAGAIARAAWSEFDTETWTVPPEEGRKFRGYARAVPLNTGALRAIRVLQEETKADAVYLFPSRAGTKAPHYSSSAWNGLIRRLRKESGVGGWTIHDLRATFRTLATRELKVRPDVADAILGHAISTVGHVHYEADKRTYLLAEKREALEAWDTFLERLPRNPREKKKGARETLPVTPGGVLAGPKPEKRIESLEGKVGAILEAAGGDPDALEEGLRGLIGWGKVVGE